MPFAIDSTMPTLQTANDDQLPMTEESSRIESANPKMCQPMEEEKLYTGKTLQLTKFHFVDADGIERTQEGIQKAKSKATHGSRNLCTIGVLKRQIMCDCLVLVKQYRAPLKAYTLEFPARVTDSKSNFEDEVTREIADDTGYTSTDIKHISPPTALDPDVSDCKVRMVSLLVDGDDPLQHPTARSFSNDSDDENNGHGDVVEVLQVPVNGLLSRLHEYSRQGVIIDSRVYAFAIGLKKGEKMALNQVVPQVEEVMY